MKRWVWVVVVLAALACAQIASAASDPLCLGSYGSASPVQGAKLRFGIDPGIAGSAVPGTPAPVADDPARDLAAVKALRPPHRKLVIRLNRLFWSDGQAGIDQFKRLVAGYARAGFDVELQVRYHPGTGQAGDIAAWKGYVRHVVDTFGRRRHVVAMTITNEVNVDFSPNTSDGYYQGATDALIGGIEAAHQEAVRKHFGQLRFGFTFAYRFAPNQDAAFFAYLGAHGGRAFQRSLGFVGLDFYPGTIYPPVMPPGDSYRSELAQAAGVVRRCFAPMAGIGAGKPIWLTENGVPTGLLSEAQQADALSELAQAASGYSRTFNITDYRWFNLRDSNSGSAENLIGPTFSSDGLLRSDYTRKPSFGIYRALIARLGARAKKLRH